MIIASDIETTAALDMSAEYLKYTLSGSLYEYVEVLDTDGIVEAIKDIEHLNGLDVEQLCNSVSDRRESYIEIIKCVYDGEPENLSDIDKDIVDREYELAYAKILNLSKVQDDDDEDII